MKVRMVKDAYDDCYWTVQIKRWWFPFWFIFNNRSYLEKDAEKIMQRLKSPEIRY